MKSSRFQLTAFECPLLNPNSSFTSRLQKRLRSKENQAEYTIASVPYGWAGSVTIVKSPFGVFSHRVTDGPTLKRRRESSLCGTIGHRALRARCPKAAFLLHKERARAGGLGETILLCTCVSVSPCLSRVKPGATSPITR